MLINYVGLLCRVTDNITVDILASNPCVQVIILNLGIYISTAFIKTQDTSVENFRLFHIM